MKGGSIRAAIIPSDQAAGRYLVGYRQHGRAALSLGSFGGTVFAQIAESLSIYLPHTLWG
jgi:hypothetical protein